MIKVDKAWKEYTIRVPDTQADQVISGYSIMRYKGSQNTKTTPYRLLVNVLLGQRALHLLVRFEI